ncbi:hypothetical protein [Helicobacter acinonychis]|uniref:Uncharacterized protein n=1 Tax=Helicobacter acinonychis (strain Sheeba) TaxID=382638 RepID=Q17VC5_HELAH|nr:hypothetical protein [Helicobacter acinonychis]CAK00401.1 hypothetical protein Hac_1699 [Helicobacter acinonychis str. Sheeba]STP05078.1 Uncharacterised protein [Helicobacter acinonychis]
MAQKYPKTFFDNKNALNDCKNLINSCYIDGILLKGLIKTLSVRLAYKINPTKSKTNEKDFLTLSSSLLNAEGNGFL